MPSSEYDRVKRLLLKSQELYEDPDFPAVQSTVFYHQTPPFQFIWKRPKELCLKPVFVSEGSGQLSVTQGKLGDRWFVSCLGILATCRALFFRVVPADQSFTEPEYTGLFRFRLWWAGEWTEVLVDDRLPTVNNKLVFVHSAGQTNHFWAALLEKAYAKLYGSYEALKYGGSLDGLTDMTGGICESVNIREDPNCCSPTLKDLLARTTLVSCVSQQNTNQQPQQHKSHAEKLANGIWLGTNYRVLAFVKVNTSNGDQIQLVKLLNSMSLSIDYVGSWSRNSAEWEKIAVEEQERLNLKNISQGEFWMPYTDFVKTFTHLELVHLDADTSRDEISLKSLKPWCAKHSRGRWQRGVTAGGCRNNAESFHINPQFQVILSDAEELVISLNQDAVVEPKVIGFTLYQTAKPIAEVLDRSYFKKSKSILSSQYSNYKQISVRCPLEQGSYVIIPTTFEPGQEASFNLRVFSGKPTKLKIIDYLPQALKAAIIKAPSSDNKAVAQYEAIFLQMADEHTSVNAFELQELLEACLPNDYVKSCATLEVCRQVVMALDSNSSGRLRFTDYKNFMCSLKSWQTTFRKHTKGTSGVLRAEKLREALVDIGFQLNHDVLSLLVLRYMRKDGTLRFGDFVSSILHLYVAFASFEKKDPLQNGSVKLNLAEWLKISLQC